VKDMLFAVLAVISAIVAAFCFYRYTGAGPAGGQTMYIVGGIVFVVVTVALGALFLSGRVNKDSDIHITE
jgi:hypothetical protein